MNKYEAYVSIDGTLVVNHLHKVGSGFQSVTNTDRVKLHLGTVYVASLNQARREFRERTGGKTHSIDVDKDIKSE